MTTSSRAIVSPPAKEGLRYGLLAVAETRSPTDGKWKNGVTWVNVCPDGNSTYDACIQGNALGVPVTGVPAAPVKTATAFRSIWGATPFTLKVEIDCSPPGFWNEAEDNVEKAFDAAEEVEVTGVFQTGTVGGQPNFQFPHLSSAALVEEVNAQGVRIPGGATLQLSTASLAPTGGSALDVVEALGKMEQALANCVRGNGVIHISAELLPHLKAQHLVEIRDGLVYTVNGTKVAVSAGYTGASPAGAVQVGVSWLYGTGPVFVYKSRAKFYSDAPQSIDRSVNTLKRIYERTYVIGYDCCLFAVPVSTGGVITGTINAAT